MGVIVTEMEHTIIEWMKEVVRLDDLRQAHYDKIYNEMKAEGKRFVTWREDRLNDEIVIMDQETREVLATVPDTMRSFDKEWEQHPEWANDDFIWEEAYEKYGWADKPEEYAFLLTEDEDPDQFRAFLMAHQLLTV